jgi:hypothetical protein
VVHEGLREHKPAAQVRREVPRPKNGTGNRTAAVKTLTQKLSPA